MADETFDSPTSVTITDHELLRPVGRGSYGEVWLARSVLGELRAVKLVWHDQRDDRPFEREFDGLRKFEPVSRSHPGLVHILHAGRFEGGFFYVMELADDAAEPRGGDQSNQYSVVSDQSAAGGTALLNTEHCSLNTSAYVPRTLRSELQRRGRLPVSECLDLALKLTDALAHLHGHGLVHRDIKPSNLIFVRGQPKLADIGLVASADASLTCVGTDGYLPPEGPGKPPADLYALGKVLYELSTGHDRNDFPELPTLLRDDPQRQELEEINEVILRACDPDLRRRYQSAQQMRADLLLLLSGRSLRGARALRQRLVFARRAGAVVGAAALLAVAAYFYQDLQTREARRLAQAEAVQRARAETLVGTLQLKEAERLFEKDEGNEGVAYLARMLRQHPSNHIAAARLMSALNDRSFAASVWNFEPWDFQVGADFNPNGRLLVTWGRSGSNRVAQLKDAATGQEVGRPMRHETNIRRARFSPDGRLLATMAADGVARIWDGFTGEPSSAALSPLGSVFRGRHIPEEHLAFSPNGQLLVTAGFREARVWNVATGELLAARLDHGAEVWDVGFSPDSRLVSTSGDNTTKLWDVASGELRHILDIGDGGGRCFARFSADGRRIVGIGGFHVRVWDVQSGERLLVLDRDCNVNSAAFSPDGVRLATADNVRTVQLFDANSGRLLLAPILHGDVVHEVSFDATGERILTREPRRARVWDSRSGRPLTEWMTFAEEIHTAQFSPSGAHVLTTTAKSITLWDVRLGQAPNLALRHARQLVPSARFSDDGTRVVTAGGGSFPSWAQDGAGEAIVWDTRTGAPQGTRIATSMGIQSAELSPDGRRLVTAGLNGEARVWDARTGAAVTPTLHHRQAVMSARFNPEGDHIVTASTDGTARIWDGATGRQVTAALEHSNVVLYAEFSADGLSVLTVPQFDAARVWDARTGRPTASFGASIVAARFSPDGQRIVTGSADGTVQVWDLKTGQPRGGPLRHRDRIESVRFSRDGRLVVTASRDQSARIWDAFSGSPLAEPLRHNGAVLDAGFSPDGQRVVTASEDYTARVWDVRTGQPLSEPLREGHFVGGAEFSPDGTRLVTATANGLARIWELPPARLPVPAWLPDLAEAMAGAHRTEQEVLEPVSPSEYLARRAELLKIDGADDQSRWLRWLLAARGDRPVSYASSATVADHLDGLLQQSELPPLREALLFSPEHPLGITRLARRLVGSEYSEMVRHPQRERQADFLSEKAVNLAPEQDEVWRTRGEVLDKIGRREEALTAIGRAIALAGKEEESWLAIGRLLEGGGRMEDNFWRDDTAVKLDSVSPHAARNREEAQPEGLRTDTLLARKRFFSGALEALERALSHAPTSPALWRLKADWLEHSGQLGAALSAYTQAMSLLDPQNGRPAPTEPGSLRTKGEHPSAVQENGLQPLRAALPGSPVSDSDALRAIGLRRATLLEQLGRHDEAVAGRLKALGIPARDPGTPPALLDLSSQYNLSFQDQTHPWEPDRGPENLDSLEPGDRFLAGVRFDVRGAIRAGGSPYSEHGRFLTPHARGLAVHQHCRRLHVLHVLYDDGQQGVADGRYVVHYEDGSRVDIPILHDKTIGYWSGGTGAGQKDLVRAWTGTEEPSPARLSWGHLYRYSWVNPKPHLRIETMELEPPQSTNGSGVEAMLLVAITAQEEPTPEITQQPAPKIVGPGAPGTLEVRVRSELPMRYQWHFNERNLQGATNATLVIPRVDRSEVGTYGVQVGHIHPDSVLQLASEPASLAIREGDLTVGLLRREVFLDLPGEKLSAMTNSTRFPQSPDSVTFVPQFETIPDFADSYGVRLTGFLMPSRSGEYHFYLSSDDEGVLFLSSDESPERRRLIAHETHWGGRRAWTAGSGRPRQENISRPVFLEAGRRYFVEALMKEGPGGDHLAVAWQPPGEPPPKHGALPISGQYLAIPSVWMDGKSGGQESPSGQ